MLSLAALPLATACEDKSATRGPPAAASSSTSPAAAPTASATGSLSGGSVSVAAPDAAREDDARDAAAPTEVTVQHVLIQYRGAKRATKSQARTRDDAKKVAEDVARRARSGEDFSQLALDLSDDPDAKNRRGSLGKVHRGDMDKRFEDAAFALKVGQISDVVETRFGFHVIKRNQ